MTIFIELLDALHLGINHVHSFLLVHPTLNQNIGTLLIVLRVYYSTTESYMDLNIPYIKMSELYIRCKGSTVPYILLSSSRLRVDSFLLNPSPAINESCIINVPDQTTPHHPQSTTISSQICSDPSYLHVCMKIIGLIGHKYISYSSRYHRGSVYGCRFSWCSCSATYRGGLIQKNLVDFRILPSSFNICAYQSKRLEQSFCGLQYHPVNAIC